MGRMRALLPDAQHHTESTELEVDIHAHYALNWLDAGGVRVNFVSSVDGSATANGLSRGLQTPGDNKVFAALRDLADVVLVGAATAAAESYRPSRPSAERKAIRARLGLKPIPAIAVMSSTLNLKLSDDLYTRADRDAPTLIITGAAASVSARTDIIDLAGSDAALQLLEAPATADGGVDFRAAITHLRELGYRRVLCEGGPRLFAAGVEAGAVDELCLSISPMLAGPNGPRIVAGDAWPDLQPKLTLDGLLTEDDALFCRYLIQK
jgi:riboflavin biosynthesis pyrimidine reductase